MIKYLKTQYFSETLNPDDILLNDSLLTSVIDIKTLIVKLAGYYENKLKFSSSISFFFSRIYNSMKQDETSNSFPLLTNLVQKIYQNFGIQKTIEECNNFIKANIKEYFRLVPNPNRKLSRTSDCSDPNEFYIDGFFKDLAILGNLFWNSDLNYKLEETIEKDWLISDNDTNDKKK